MFFRVLVYTVRWQGTGALCKNSPGGVVVGTFCSYPHHHLAWQRTEWSYVYEDTRMRMTDWATLGEQRYGGTVDELSDGWIYSPVSRVDRSHLIWSHIILWFNIIRNVYTLTFDSTCTVQSFVDPHNWLVSQHQVELYLLTILMCS